MTTVPDALSWFVPSADVDARLDAEFYLPAHLALIERITATGVSVRLVAIEEGGAYGVLPGSNEYGSGTLPLIRGRNLDGQALTAVPPDVPLVPDSYYRHSRGRMRPSDVLLLIKGATIDAPESVGVVSESWQHRSIINGSIYKFGVRDPHDAYYVCAFFGTKYGLTQKTRWIANTGISYNDQDAIRSFHVAIPEPSVQRAIGNLLRSAERMRYEADALLSQSVDGIEELFTSTQIRSNELRGERYTALSAAPAAWLLTDSSLTSSRLDASYYEPKYLDSLNRLKALALEVKELRSICSRVNCGSTPKKVVYGVGGTPLIRTSNVRPNEYDDRDVQRVAGMSVERESALAILPGDVLYTMSGSVGYSSVYPQDGELASCSNTIARARVLNKDEADPYYVALFLNCSFGRLQSLRLISGGVQGHVMPNPVKKLLIALPAIDVQRKLGDRVRLAEKLRKDAREHVRRAHRCVEAFIEGRRDVVDRLVAEDANTRRQSVDRARNTQEAK